MTPDNKQDMYYVFEDNMQHMLDPCNPMGFLQDDLRYDWLRAAVRYWKCDIAA